MSSLFQTHNNNKAEFSAPLNTRTDSKSAGSSFAIMDMGSNSFRLCIFKFNECGVEEKVKFVETCRMGEGFHDTLTIQPVPMARCLATVEKLLGICRENFVENVFCFATATVREATNREEFISACKRLGLDIHILSGKEEALCGFLGACGDFANSCDGENNAKQKFAILDIGGASTEVAIGYASDYKGFFAGLDRFPTHGEIIEKSKGTRTLDITSPLEFSHSFKVGAVRMTDMFGEDFEGLESYLRELFNEPLQVAIGDPKGRACEIFNDGSQNASILASADHCDNFNEPLKSDAVSMPCDLFNEPKRSDAFSAEGGFFASNFGNDFDRRSASDFDNAIGSEIPKNAVVGNCENHVDNSEILSSDFCKNEDNFNSDISQENSKSEGDFSQTDPLENSKSEGVTLEKINLENAILLGIGGTATSVCGLVLGCKNYDPKLHGYDCSLEKINDLSAKLQNMTEEERMALPHLKEKRKEIITAGTVILQTAMKTFGSNTIKASLSDNIEGYRVLLGL